MVKATTRNFRHLTLLNSVLGENVEDLYCQTLDGRHNNQTLRDAVQRDLGHCDNLLDRHLRVQEPKHLSSS